jgi:hypothetical protein
VDTHQRNQQLVSVVEKYLLEDSYQAALTRTQKEMKTLGLHPILGVRAIRKVYENTPSLDPVRDAAVYYEVKTLCEYGLSEKEAEQEATHRLFHLQRLILSPQLTHQICKRYIAHHPRGY